MKKKIFKFIDVVEYQDNSIVSKQIVNQTNGNITLFAFTKGQQINEHSAPFDAIVQVLEGECEIIIANESFKMSAGEVIVMPKNEPHAVKSISNFKMLLTMIK